MGIDGLLRLNEIKDACKPVTHAEIRRMFGRKGKIAAIDANIWIHCGIKASSNYIDYFISMAKFVCIDLGMIPLLVFDGLKLPAKSGTHHKREE